jgi:hypothetical protein
MALGDMQGPAIGQWEHIAPTKVRMILITPLYKNGVVNGFFRVRDTLTLSESGQQWTDVLSQVEWLDLNLNVVFSAAGAATGTRLESPQGCQQQP